MSVKLAYLWKSHKRYTELSEEVAGTCGFSFICSALNPKFAPVFERSHRWVSTDIHQTFKLRTHFSGPGEFSIFSFLTYGSRRQVLSMKAP